MSKTPLEAYNDFYSCPHEEWACTGCGVHMSRQHLQLESELLRNAIKAGGYFVTICLVCEKTMVCPVDEEKPICRPCLLKPPEVGV